MIVFHPLCICRRTTIFIKVKTIETMKIILSLWAATLFYTINITSHKHGWEIPEIMVISPIGAQ